jgi:gliding motility-associated-like protein
MRDAAHTSCTADLNGGSGSIAIAQPNVLSATVGTTDATCNGVADGKITLSLPTGGYGTFEYAVDAGSWQSLTSFNGLSSGTHSVSIRDAAHTGCSVSLGGFSIAQPQVLTAAVGTTNLSCYGANDGVITISLPSGGSGTYDYSKDGGSSWQILGSGSFSGLASTTTYDVYIRDNAHPSCTVDLDGSTNTTITQPAILAATVTPTGANCFGIGNGAIAITGVSGGYGTYEYSDNGGTNWQSSATFGNLVGGNYNVFVRDAAHTTCFVDLDGLSNTTTVAQPNQLVATVTPTNITCNNANDGKINITSPAGGGGSYEYSIDGGNNWFSSGSFTTLSVGAYGVVIRDAAQASCSVDLDGSSDTNITQPGPVTASVSSTNVTCNGSNNGAIIISSPLGGYGTYEYTIDNGGHWFSSGSFTGLANGPYNIKIRDAAQPLCVTDLDGGVNTTITQPNVLAATVTSGNVSCNGSSDGTISLSLASGGYGTFEYSIDGGSNWFPSGSFTTLSNGTYNVKIRDAAHNTCEIDLDGTANTSISQPPALTATVGSTNLSCNGNNDGTITISSSAGGYGAYEYSIDGGLNWQSSSQFTGVTNSTYNVLIRDAQHPSCTVDLDGTTNTTLTEPGVLNASVTSTNVTCHSSNDGTIAITSATGGYGTYEYSINGGTTWIASGAFANVAPATYSVLVRDGAHNACVINLDGISSTIISEPSALSATLSSSNVTATGANDGTISISLPTGGSGSYEYSINGGGSWQSSGSFSSLTNGTYNVLMRDAAQPTCSIDLDGTINTLIESPLQLTVAVSNVSCFGAGNGSLTGTGSFGAAPYSYSIDGTNFGSSGTFANLTPGSYSLSVKDTDGTVVTTSATVDQPGAALAAAVVTKTQASCFHSSSATLTVAGTNGTSPYSYSVDGTNFVNTSTFTALAAGNYTVYIKDANGCQASTNASIAEPDEVIATAIGVTVNGDDTGSIAAVANGGTPPYTYSWTGPDSFFAASDTIGSLLPGVYSVTVTDANHCVSGVAAFTITFKIYEGISPNGDGKNDYWRIDGIEGYPNNSIRIFDRFNNLVYETHGYSNETNHWTGQSNHGISRDALPDGTYFYAVELGDGKGTKSGYVVLKRH